MAAPSLAGAAPRDGGSSPSATSGPSGNPSSSDAGRGVPKGRRFGFDKSKRLLKRKDFQRVYNEGNRQQSASFSVFCLKRPEQTRSRIGFSLPRALGKAVIRNRIRRKMREAVRLEYWRLEASWDLVFHPRRAATDTPLAALRREVERILSRCGTS